MVDIQITIVVGVDDSWLVFCNLVFDGLNKIQQRHSVEPVVGKRVQADGRTECLARLACPVAALFDFVRGSVFVVVSGGHTIREDADVNILAGGCMARERAADTEYLVVGVGCDTEYGHGCRYFRGPWIISVCAILKTGLPLNTDMNVIFLGVNDVGLRIYEWLCERETVDVTALLTEKAQLELVHESDPDLLVSVGFDHLVPPDVLNVPSQGAVNLHPALLPHNRGKSPNVWSLVEGTPAGVTLHYMDESFDTGEIIAQREVEMDFTDTGKTLHRRLEGAQFDLFTDAWPAIEAGGVETTPQDESTGEYHSVEDFQQLCELDPNEEIRVKDFLDRLRALTFPPFDNAHIEVDGETYYVDIEIRNESDDSGAQSEGLLSSY